MAVKKFNPITPARRQMTMPTFEEITSQEPEKSLLVALKSKRVEMLKVKLLLDIVAAVLRENIE